MNEGMLGKLVVVSWGDGKVRGVGRLIAYTDQPTATVELSDGTRINSVASLVEQVGTGEQSEQMAEFVVPSKINPAQPIRTLAQELQEAASISPALIRAFNDNTSYVSPGQGLGPIKAVGMRVPTPHEKTVHVGCEKTNCNICDGGLFVCKNCGKAEAELSGPCLPWGKLFQPVPDQVQREILPELAPSDREKIRRISKVIADIQRRLQILEEAE